MTSIITIWPGGPNDPGIPSLPSRPSLPLTPGTPYEDNIVTTLCYVCVSFSHQIQVARLFHSVLVQHPHLDHPPSPSDPEKHIHNASPSMGPHSTQHPTWVTHPPLQTLKNSIHYTWDVTPKSHKQSDGIRSDQCIPQCCTYPMYNTYRFARQSRVPYFTNKSFGPRWSLQRIEEQIKLVPTEDRGEFILHRPTDTISCHSATC